MAALAAAAKTDDVGERLALLTRAKAELDASIMATVVQARGAERSWADIGSHLGVTRQAAQGRFGAACKPNPTSELGEAPKVARHARPRSELVQLATAGGRPLLRLRVDRVPLPAQRRQIGR